MYFRKSFSNFRALYSEAYDPQYTYNAAGHALGDIGEVSMRDIEADDYYIRGDYVGKQGIEKSYEKYLRGEKE